VRFKTKVQLQNPIRKIPSSKIQTQNPPPEKSTQPDMHSLLLAIFFCYALVLAQDLTELAPGPWIVRHFVPGCGISQSACEYFFNITYTPPAGSDPDIIEPGFNTFCTGTDFQDGLVDCDDPTVSAMNIPGIGEMMLYVQHIYSLDDIMYAVYGDATITNVAREGQRFEIIPSEIDILS
jgi:hypothetical protein